MRGYIKYDFRVFVTYSTMPRRPRTHAWQPTYPIDSNRDLPQDNINSSDTPTTNRVPSSQMERSTNENIYTSALGYTQSQTTNASYSPASEWVGTDDPLLHHEPVNATDGGEYYQPDIELTTASIQRAFERLTSSPLPTFSLRDTVSGGTNGWGTLPEDGAIVEMLYFAPGDRPIMARSDWDVGSFMSISFDADTRELHFDPREVSMDSLRGYARTILDNERRNRERRQYAASSGEPFFTVSGGMHVWTSDMLGSFSRGRNIQTINDPPQVDTQYNVPPMVGEDYDDSDDD